MKTVRLMSAVRVFGRLTLLSSTFLLGVFATAMFAAIFDSAASSSPAQQPLAVPAYDQTSSAPQPTVEPQPAASSASGTKDSDAWPDIPPLALSRGRTLLTRGTTLHMLDANNRVLWSWSTSGDDGPFITDQPLVDSSGTLYVVGTNSTHVALDLSSGREKWGAVNSNGRYSFRQIEKYTNDQYLILSKMTSDQESEHGDILQSFLAAYKGEEMLWSSVFPRDAELIVRGGKIYALIYNENGLEMREINPSDREFSCSC